MQRFKNKEDVVIGARIIFNNLTAYCRELPKIQMIGDITGMEEDDKVIVDLYIAGHEEPVRVKLPFYILQ